MATDYILLKTERGFEVTDPYGDSTIFFTEAAAKADIAESKKNDEMLETGKTLVDMSIRSHMEIFGVDRETAKYWIKSAAEVMD
jgi:hypothetical protein